MEIFLCLLFRVANHELPMKKVIIACEKCEEKFKNIFSDIIKYYQFASKTDNII